MFDVRVVRFLEEIFLRRILFLERFFALKNPLKKLCESLSLYYLLKGGTRCQKASKCLRRARRSQSATKRF